MVPENIHPPPPHGRDRNFQGGEGVNLPNFPGKGGGLTIGKYFQRVLVAHERVTKKKTKIYHDNFICKDIKYEPLMTCLKFV